MTQWPWYYGDYIKKTFFSIDNSQNGDQRSPVMKSSKASKLKQRKSQTWRKFGYPALISIDVDDFAFPCTPVLSFSDYISNTLDSVSSHIQTPRISSKILVLSTFFSMFGYPDQTRLSCLMYYITKVTMLPLTQSSWWAIQTILFQLSLATRSNGWGQPELSRDITFTYDHSPAQYIPTVRLLCK